MFLSEVGSFYDVKSSHVHFTESLLLNSLSGGRSRNYIKGRYILLPIGIADVKT